MQNLAKQLRLIEAEMANWVNPENKNGFYRKFVFWVYSTWSKVEYIDSSVIDVGYDVSFYPARTGTLASKVCKTYSDFINSNTGNSIATYCSGSGMRCEEYSEKLQVVFSDACYEKLTDLANKFPLTLPDKYKEYCADINEMIFYDVVDSDEDPELYEVCDSIVSRFSGLGYDLEPYTCDICGLDSNCDPVVNESIFSSMTLDDFKKMVLVE